ncbi:right-handed parallel beta-helix repeat-containing protein [Nannocystis radixulma]|uniref:Right-handed parallel beta-helix repeat-containing protein n=1 Tax=Nannocystis radixulma TaxID=2995305 RepID=A0ABT5BN30_9BACT|nr:right-handed parallel beta-helix repeat-containing protein [Nannocystis radixulma]MDC0674407.1 right-handed parallel beta-helix repeat-containing protein [Nannocystis radixulma]
MIAPKFVLSSPLLLALLTACGGPTSDTTGTAGGSSSAGDSSDSSTAPGATEEGPITASPTDGGATAPTTADSDPGTTSTTSTTGTTAGTTGEETDDIAIGEWTDLPGACPDGTTRVDLTTVAELGAASRGEGEYADDGPGTCYFIHDGDYAGEDPLLYVVRGGTADAPIVFVGESRDGVRLRGRVTFAEEGSHVVLTNMTFDIAGFDKGDAFNTASVEAVEDITIDHVTFTGDCKTGEDGGHIESNHAERLRIEACLIERYGRCGPEGHQDHGIYLASGSDITVVNNVIRDNASRGIQLYTQGGEYGQLDGIVIERNRITGNGHADYEDGIVINGEGEGTITDVVVRRNLIYGNYYAGVRFAGSATDAIVIERNTFHANGAGSAADARSEINLDDAGKAANATITRNLFAGGHNLVNDCYDAADMAFGIDDNVVDGPVTGGDAACVGAVIAEDPQFADTGAADFHPANPAVAAYGAYAD